MNVKIIRSTYYYVLSFVVRGNLMFHYILYVEGEEKKKYRVLLSIHE